MAGKPEGWKFTIKSMASQCKDSYTATNSAIKELLEIGLVEREIVMTKNGKRCFYSIYEKPNIEKPNMEKPNMESQCLESQVWKSNVYSNTNISNKEESNKENRVVTKVTKAEPLNSENQVVKVDKKNRKVDKTGKVVGGNVNTERAYELWEEVMGYPCKRDKWNSGAGYNMVRAKNKGEEWLRKMLIIARECKSDPKADFRAKNIANLFDIQKNQDYLLDWARQKVAKKPNVVRL